ncbi:ABC transporter substrate-binding protein [uncultured Eubacterium sp.]|uniref:ABC transporter substrate-binding protein n=1 Tax=uncultured Eubacterium sp. TaxID=165185 RepID=UPI00280434D6|nr:ABC transporter substrate-binding protein [uncultured Eubacterium sp.]
MKTIKKIIAVVSAIAIIFSFAACAKNNDNSTFSDVKTYKVGICNYVDDASLNQIVENIQSQLEKAGTENNVKFDVTVQNCNADASVMNQIISDFIANSVDLMVGVATPVAVAMQAATEDKNIPVVFAAVSDPVGAGLVADKDAPGANVTGTSDYLNTDAIMDLILANKADTKNVALLYDMGQDSSKTPIENAKKYLEAKGISYKEYTGTNVTEVQQAVATIIKDGADAVFTPTDNTIMTAELSIYESLAKAGIPHYTGADSFALNGAFLGYGVDYAALGQQTADMIADILVNGKDVASYPVKFFDNGTATINTEICTELGLDFSEVESKSKPFCTEIKTITTAESFS